MTQLRYYIYNNSIFQITNEETFYRAMLIIQECSVWTFQLNSLITSRNVNLNGMLNVQRVNGILVVINVIIIITLKNIHNNKINFT
jgi:hypothetical protein